MKGQEYHSVVGLVNNNIVHKSEKRLQARKGDTGTSEEICFVDLKS